MSDTKFYKEIGLLFENYLSPKKDNLQLRIKDIDKNLILQESNTMNYTKVLFDSDLNIYKINKEGKVIKIESDNFETVVMRQEK